jgi:RND superfamily putative drug exporter
MLRRPRRTVGLAIACVVALAAIGLNVESGLAPISISMPGTEAAKGEAQLREHFGDSAPFAILLRGPAPDLEREGPQLIEALRENPRVSTISPWDRGAVPALRPAPGKALIFADFHVPIAVAVTEVAPKLEETVGRSISGPVRPTITGYAMLWRGLKSANETAAERGELIAFPLLLIVLLFVFRSPVAAAIPVLFGLATLVSSRGLIALASGWFDVDPLTLPVSSMVGLALGVDYALLMVSRFREELATGTAPAPAARITRETAGRTLATAGATLFFSLLVALFVVPGRLFAELLGVVMMSTALSVAIAWTVGPAVLSLLGAKVDRWRIGAPIRPRARWMDWVERALRRPGPVALLVAVPMILLSLPLLELDLGASGLNQLPGDSDVRRDAETVSAAVGPGWAAPFIVVASTEHGSVLDPGRSRAIARWQHRVAEDPGVLTVIGPSQLVRRLAPLRKFGDSLIDKRKDGPLGLGGLGSKLGRLANGVSGLRTGMAKAAQGAGLLGTGSERAQAGAVAIASGLLKASQGGKRATEGIGRLRDGSQQLLKGQRAARFGALQLQLGLDTVAPNVGRKALGPAKSLHHDLAQRAASEPELATDAQRAGDLVARLTKARNEIGQLHKMAAGLRRGLTALTAGGVKLQGGTAQLASAAGGLQQGLAKLQDGSERLASGLGSLSGGTRTLGEKLAEGFHGSRPLQSGARQASAKVSDESEQLETKVSAIRRFSPRVFDSGYFMVSALDGVRSGTRPNIEQSVSVQRGGQAVQLLVIPKDSLNSPGSTALYDRLQEQTPELAREARVEVGITGGNAQLIDYARAARERIPLLIVAIFLATLLMLIVFLRALWLSVLAALLNLATVAVAFGALALMSHLPSGVPLGGFGAIEVTGAMSVFCVAFGLSIDYAVFLLMRMRESYDRDHDHARAVAVGLEKTARVITGAAAIMTVVFVAFASSQIAIMTQIGVGLAVAVALDATVVRMLFLPALMLLLGERLWWLPSPLRRLLGRGRQIPRPRAAAEVEAPL